MKIHPLLGIILCVSYAIVPAEAQNVPQGVATTQPRSLTTWGSSQINRLMDQYESIQMSLERGSVEYGARSPQMVQMQAMEEVLAQRMRKSTEVALDSSEAEAELARRSLQVSQAQVRDTTGRLDFSPDGLEAAIRSLEQQRQTLVIEQAGAQARRKAIEKVISEQSAHADEVAKGDPVIVEIAALVNVRQKQVDTLSQSQKQGLATPADLLNAQAALAEANVKLAERRKDLVAENGADSVAGLNAKLIDMTVDESQREATLKCIREQLDKFGSEPDLPGQLRRCQDRLNEAEAELQQAGREARQVEQELTLSPPPNMNVPPTTQPGNTR